MLSLHGRVALIVPGRQIRPARAQIEFMLGEIYRWISRAGLLCLAVGGCVPLAAPPQNGPSILVGAAGLGGWNMSGLE